MAALHPVHLAILGLFCAACARAGPSDGKPLAAGRLEAGQRQTALTLSTPADGPLLLEVTPTGDGADRPVELAVSLDDRPGVVQTISLYPPGRRGTFLIAAPRGTWRVSLSATPAAAGAPALEFKVRPAPMRP